jgi:alanyl-tRNA synthetase
MKKKMIKEIKLKFFIGLDRKVIDGALKILKEKCPNAALMLFSRNEKEVVLMCYVPKVRGSLHAGDWAKEVAVIVNGKGGGKPDSAQAAGNDSSKIPEAIAKAIQIAKSKI